LLAVFPQVPIPLPVFVTVMAATRAVSLSWVLRPSPGDVVKFEVGYDARDCSALATNICPTGERVRSAVARTTQ
jgi:hypothetical protein